MSFWTTTFHLVFGKRGGAAPTRKPSQPTAVPTAPAAAVPAPPAAEAALAAAAAAEAPPITPPPTTEAVVETAALAAAPASVAETMVESPQAPPPASSPVEEPPIAPPPTAEIVVETSPPQAAPVEPAPEAPPAPEAIENHLTPAATVTESTPGVEDQSVEPASAGAPPSSTEPAAAEALAGAPPEGAVSAPTPAAPPVSASDFASKLVALCKSELEFFRDGALKETDEPAKSRIAQYWSHVGQAGWDGSTPEPWSAAFISYAVGRAGDHGRFKKSTGHADYINDAIARKNDPAAAFQGKRIEEYAPQRGDLSARPRADSKVTFDTAVAAGWYKSHTDAVMAIKPGHVEMVGGNVSNSVSARQLPLLQDGRLEPVAAKKEGVFAILRCNL